MSSSSSTFVRPTATEKEHNRPHASCGSSFSQRDASRSPSPSSPANNDNTYTCNNNNVVVDEVKSPHTKTKTPKNTSVSSPSFGDEKEHFLGQNGNRHRPTRLLYVAVALSEIDHVTFHHLKFHQLCRVTRAEAPRPYPPPQTSVDVNLTTATTPENNNSGEVSGESLKENAEEDYVDFRMLAFTKEGTFVSQWVHDDDRDRFAVTSPMTIPSIEAVPFEDPVIVDTIEELYGTAAEGENSNDEQLQQQLQKGEREKVTGKDGAALCVSYPRCDSEIVLEDGESSAAILQSGNENGEREKEEEVEVEITNAVNEHIRIDNTIIEGRRDERRKRTLCLVRVSDVCAFDLERMRHFLDQNMAKGKKGKGKNKDKDTCKEDEEPVENHLIYGAHGYGFALGVNVRVVRGDDDYAMLERCEEDSGYYVSISLLDLVGVLEGMRFRSICFDCCLMSTAQNAAAMFKVSPYVLACEGYMWEEDDDVERHVLNSYSARYLCFGVDGGEETFAGHDGPFAAAVDNNNNNHTSNGDNNNRSKDGGVPTRSLSKKSDSVSSSSSAGERHGVPSCSSRGASPPSPAPSPASASASDLSRALRVKAAKSDVLPELFAVARHFAQNSPRGDVAVLSTEAGTLLYHHLLLSKVQLVPFLHRPASLTTARPLARDILGPAVQLLGPLDSRDPDVGAFLYDVRGLIENIAAHVIGTAESPLLLSSVRPIRSDGLLSATSSNSNNNGLLIGASPPSSSSGAFSSPPATGVTSLTRDWVLKAEGLWAATVLLHIPPAAKEALYYTCTHGGLNGISVKL